MGETLRRKVGFMPVWAWVLAFVVIVAIYLSYRKNKAAAAAAAAQGQQNNLSSNLGTVPVSNLTTAAQPMPIQMGDTFVNTTVPQTITQTVNPPFPTRWIPWKHKPPAWNIQTPPLPAPSPVIAPIQQPPTPPPPPQTLPGYGAGLGQLIANNPGIMSANTPGGANIPGITGYNVSYNGVPL